MTIKSKLIIGVSAAVISIGAWSIYEVTKVQASEEAAAQAPQAMPVKVSAINPKPVKLWENYSGHIVAVDQAEVRPQVTGRIVEIKFEDGQYVEKGDVLIVIDPRPFEAVLQQAEAALISAKTAEDFAVKEYERAQSLVKTDAISKSLFDERLNAKLNATALVKAAEASVSVAKLDLDYAYIKAPIAGTVSRAEITEGNLVQAGPNAPLLTSVVADERVYADFEVDERTYIEAKKNQKDGKADKVPVRLSIESTEHIAEGYIQSFDNRISSETGTIRARAIFDNKNKFLLPGMTVSVSMGKSIAGDAIMLTERAIGTNQDRKFVYVVDEQNIVKYREVKLGESVDGARLILSGLSKGDKVITEGLVRVRPEMPVSPQIQED